MLTFTRETLAELVAERDRCSGGRSEGCATCGLRHSCRLDDGANAAGEALRAYSALHSLSDLIDEARRADWTPERVAALVRANLTTRDILRPVEWESEDV
jgi:hypothetical protein